MDNEEYVVNLNILYTTFNYAHFFLGGGIEGVVREKLNTYKMVKFALRRLIKLLLKLVFYSSCKERHAEFMVKFAG